MIVCRAFTKRKRSALEIEQTLLHPQSSSVSSETTHPAIDLNCTVGARLFVNGSFCRLCRTFFGRSKKRQSSTEIISDWIVLIHSNDADDEEGISLLDIHTIVRDHGKRLDRCESEQKQLWDQLQYLSNLLLTSISHSSSGEPSETTSTATIRERVANLKGSHPTINTEEDRREYVNPPLLPTVELPPLKHSPVERGFVEYWDDLMVDVLASELIMYLQQAVRERQQLLLLKRQLLLIHNVDAAQATQWYDDELSSLDVGVKHRVFIRSSNCMEKV